MGVDLAVDLDVTSVKGVVRDYQGGNEHITHELAGVHRSRCRGEAKYSGAPFQGHPRNKDTSVLRTCVPKNRNLPLR